MYLEYELLLADRPLSVLNMLLSCTTCHFFTVVTLCSYVQFYAQLLCGNEMHVNELLGA